MLVLMNDLRGNPAIRDLAEETVRFAHGTHFTRGGRAEHARRALPRHFVISPALVPSCLVG
jgi:hypothetical protein